MRREAPRKACRYDPGPPPRPAPRRPASADQPRPTFQGGTPRPLGLQPRYEDVALETLIEPELLIAAGQLR